MKVGIHIEKDWLPEFVVEMGFGRYIMDDLLMAQQELQFLKPVFIRRGDGLPQEGKDSVFRGQEKMGGTLACCGTESAVGMVMLSEYLGGCKYWRSVLFGGKMLKDIFEEGEWPDVLGFNTRVGDSNAKMNIVEVFSFQYPVVKPKILEGLRTALCKEISETEAALLPP
ncbi:hypothetical protein NDU88_004882 [Pleurodeles waltl]|uniref:Uncharacterized protein n=1 Tax=Pleurodeles waltl TaxID=8319 RepID=A0AAV7MYU0_PLEWA|nr:hypothetical protein NDU88_004882 [Pleurodeles waltl]